MAISKFGPNNLEKLIEAAEITKWAMDQNNIQMVFELRIEN